MGESLDFAVLGPLVVRRAGALLDMGRRRQRLLLIRLLLAEGHTVAPETLCEELWPQPSGREPGGAMASLHAHVSKVRAILEPRHLRGRRSFEVLVTEPLGYALHIPPDSRDTVRFEREPWPRRAGRWTGAGPRASWRTERALEMWRGAALADAAPYLFATPEAARLEELLQTARELRTTALLLDGQTQKAVDAARELTTQHPLRETGWDLLLRALYLAEHDGHGDRPRGQPWFGSSGRGRGRGRPRRDGIRRRTAVRRGPRCHAVRAEHRCDTVRCEERSGRGRRQEQVSTGCTSGAVAR